GQPPVKPAIKPKPTGQKLKVTAKTPKQDQTNTVQPTPKSVLNPKPTADQKQKVTSKAPQHEQAITGQPSIKPALKTIPTSRTSYPKPRPAFRPTRITI